MGVMCQGAPHNAKLEITKLGRCCQPFLSKYRPVAQGSRSSAFALLRAGSADFPAARAFSAPPKARRGETAAPTSRGAIFLGQRNGARHAWPELDPSEQFENRPDKSGRQPAFMQPRPARRESDLGGVALKPQQLVAELLELFALRLKGAPQLLLPLAALLVQVSPKFLQLFPLLS